MPFTIETARSEFRPADLPGFVRRLRGFTQSSVLKHGTYVLWELFRSDTPFGGDFWSPHTADAHIMRAYGARVLMLSLATANDFRGLDMTTPKGFAGLCAEYLHIPVSINFQDFMNTESRAIREELLGVTDRNQKIPVEFLREDLLRAACTRLFLSRGIGMQHQAHLASLHELHRDYEILKLMNAQGGNIAEEGMAEVFGLSTLQVVRAALVMFGVASTAKHNGVLNFDTLTCDQTLTDLMQVDLEVCRKVAEVTACSEAALLEGWYKEEVLAEEKLYQQFVPDPLISHPFVHRDKGQNKNQYLIPSPYSYLRAWRQAIFGRLYKASRRADFGQVFGDALESHIETALRHIFGNDVVTKFTHEGKKADFHVVLPKVELVIEVKAQVGQLADTAVLSPAAIKRVWGRLYSACKQCSASIAQLEPTDKLRIAVILVAEHMTAEPIPFQAFAEESGLMASMGLRAVEFITWTGLEHVLGGTSIESFQDVLIEKWANPAPMDIGTLMTLEFPPAETPAHDYEYLKAVADEIVPPREDR